MLSHTRDKHACAMHVSFYDLIQSKREVRPRAAHKGEPKAYVIYGENHILKSLRIEYS